MESVWKRNHKCRPVSFRSDVPEINGLEIHTKCRSHQSALACAEQKWAVECVCVCVCVCVCEDSLWSLWTLLRSPRRFEPNVAEANETHYAVYEFGKGETIEILSHKLGGGGGGWRRVEEGGGALHNAGQGAVNMRDVRVLCVFM